MPVVFIYSHEDREFVDSLASQLVMRKAWVWVDRWELNVGESIVERVQSELERASAVIAVLSPSSIGSRWVQRELQSVIYREVTDNRTLILPVLIEDCTIPAFLVDKKYADFRVNFDEGLQVLLETLARVTSATQGRLEAPDFHTDWAIDRGTIDGRMLLRVTLIDHSNAFPYSVLSTVDIVGNPVATRRYKDMERRGIGWLQEQTVLEIGARFAHDQDVSFVLESAAPKEMHAQFRDKNSEMAYDFVYTSRWVGTDTGREVLIRLGKSLMSVVEDSRNRIRKPNDAEKAEIAKLIQSWLKSQGSK